MLGGGPATAGDAARGPLRQPAATRRAPASGSQAADRGLIVSSGGWTLRMVRGYNSVIGNTRSSQSTKGKESTEMKSRFAIVGPLCTALFTLLLAAAPAVAQSEGHEGHAGMSGHEEMKAEGHQEMGQGHEMSAEEAAMMQAWQAAMTPGPQHEQLAKAAGDFSFVAKMWMDPAAPPAVSEGTSHREMAMDGRYLIEHVEGTMMERPFHGMGITGYDNVKGKYWNSWMDDMGTGVMNSEGSADGAGKMVMIGTYADPMGGGTKTAKTVLWWEGNDTQVMEMYDQRGDDWVKVMEITSKRK